MPANRESFGWYIKNMIRSAVHVSGTAAGTGPSPDLWAGAPVLQTMLDPTEGFYYFDDFMGQITPTDDVGWAITLTTSGSIAGVTTLQGGAIKFDSAGNTTSDDGIEAQLTNCMVKPAAGVKIWFEARVKMNDATDLYYLGLAGVDTTLMASGVVDDVVDKCGFYHEAASTDNKISAISARTTVEEKFTDIGTNEDDTFVKLGFMIDGLTAVYFYRNGVLVKAENTAAKIPNAVMCLSAVSKIEVAGADAEMTWDWVRLVQEGGRST
jgi:hypothetical protein